MLHLIYLSTAISDFHMMASFHLASVKGGSHAESLAWLTGELE